MGSSNFFPYVQEALLGRVDPDRFAEAQIDAGVWNLADANAFLAEHKRVRESPEEIARVGAVANRRGREEATPFWTEKLAGELPENAFLRNLQAGGAGAVQSIGSAMARPFSKDASREIWEQAQILDAAAAEADKASSAPEWANAVLRGSARSALQAVATAPLGGAGMIAGFAASEANESYHAAKAAGMTDAEARNHALLAGAIEGGVAGVFQATGMGGLEKYLGGGRQLSRAGMKSLLKQTGIALLQEVPEEILTEALHYANNSLAGLEKPSLEGFAKTMGMTLAQTILTVGTTVGTKGAAAQPGLRRRDRAIGDFARTYGVDEETVRAAWERADEASRNEKQWRQVFEKEIDPAMRAAQSERASRRAADEDARRRQEQDAAGRRAQEESRSRARAAAEDAARERAEAARETDDFLAGLSDGEFANAFHFARVHSPEQMAAREREIYEAMQDAQRRDRGAAKRHAARFKDFRRANPEWKPSPGMWETGVGAPPKSAEAALDEQMRAVLRDPRRHGIFSPDDVDGFLESNSRFPKEFGTILRAKFPAQALDEAARKAEKDRVKGKVVRTDKGRMRVLGVTWDGRYELGNSRGDAQTLTPRGVESNGGFVEDAPDYKEHQVVMAVLPGARSKLSRARIDEYLGDGAYRVYWRGRGTKFNETSSEIYHGEVDESQIQLSASQQAAKRYREEIDALPEDERTQVRKDSRDFDALIRESIVLYPVEAGRATSVSAREAAYEEGRRIKDAREKAARFLGVDPAETASPVGRAKHLEALRAWLAGPGRTEAKAIETELAKRRVEAEAEPPAEEAKRWVDTRAFFPDQHERVFGAELRDGDQVLHRGEWLVAEIDDEAGVIRLHDGRTLELDPEDAIPVLNGQIVGQDGEIREPAQDEDASFDFALPQEEGKGGAPSGRGPRPGGSPEPVAAVPSGQSGADTKTASGARVQDAPPKPKVQQPADERKAALSPEAEAEAVRKAEPWQLTLSRMENLLRTSDREDMPALVRALQALEYDAEFSQGNDPWNIWRTVNRQDEFPRVPTVELSRRMRKMLRRAVQEGKPVPPEVLAEWPDLMATPKPTGSPRGDVAADLDTAREMARKDLLDSFAKRGNQALYKVLAEAPTREDAQRRIRQMLTQEVLRLPADSQGRRILDIIGPDLDEQWFGAWAAEVYDRAAKIGMPGDGTKPGPKGWGQFLVAKGLLYEGSVGKKTFEHTLREVIPNNRWLQMGDVVDRYMQKPGSGERGSATRAIARIVGEWADASILARMWDAKGNPHYAWTGATPPPGMLTLEEVEAREAAEAASPPPSPENIEQLDDAQFDAMFDAALEQSAKPEAPAPAPPAADSRPWEDNNDEYAQWWDHDLTTAGRSDVLAVGGVQTLSPRTTWRNISDDNKRKIYHLKPPAAKAAAISHRVDAAEEASQEAQKPQWSWEDLIYRARSVNGTATLDALDRAVESGEIAKLYPGKDVAELREATEAGRERVAKDSEEYKRKQEAARQKRQAEYDATKGEPPPKADSALETAEEIEARIASVKRQIANLEAVRNPRDFRKHNEKVVKLNQRLEALQARQAKPAISPENISSPVRDRVDHEEALRIVHERSGSTRAADEAFLRKNVLAAEHKSGNGFSRSKLAELLDKEYPVRQPPKPLANDGTSSPVRDRAAAIEPTGSPRGNAPVVAERSRIRAATRPADEVELERLHRAGILPRAENFDIWVTKANTDVSAVAKQAPQLAFQVEDTFGATAVIPAEEFARLVDVPAFDHRIKQVTVVGYIDRMHAMPGFMNGLFENRAQLTAETDAMATLPKWLSVDLQTPLSRDESRALSAAVGDPDLQREMRRFGVRTVHVAPPHSLLLAGGATALDGSVDFNPAGVVDARSAKETLYHELGHYWAAALPATPVNWAGMAAELQERIGYPQQGRNEAETRHYEMERRSQLYALAHAGDEAAWQAYAILDRKARPVIVDQPAENLPPSPPDPSSPVRDRAAAIADPASKMPDWARSLAGKLRDRLAAGQETQAEGAKELARIEAAVAKERGRDIGEKPTVQPGLFGPEEGGPEPDLFNRPQTPPPPKARSAADAIRDAAKHGVKGLDDVARGLYDLFGGNTMGAGPRIDRATYEKAKPLFQRAYGEFRESGKALAEFFRWVVDNFGANVREYLRAFRDDLAGKLDPAIFNSETDNAADAADSPENPPPGGPQPPVRDGDRGAGAGEDAGDVAGDAAADAGRPPRAPRGKAVRPAARGKRVRGGDQQPGTPGDAAAGREGAGGEGLVSDGAGGGEAGGGTLGRPGPDRGDGEGYPGVGAPEATPNYRIRDPERLFGGSPRQRFEKNRAAIETYLDLARKGRQATDAERDALAAYSGWGSFGQELFDGSWDNPKPKPEWREQDEWLREHLGKEAWQSAQRSILNAHYTDPPTVSAMWEMVRRMGFKGGRVLEPSMGIGNFFGLMPPELAAKSDLTGIELDETTGGMAKLLYPQANIAVKGYQESRTPEGFYDLVIGNWPFAAEGPADRRYDKLSPSLHDYFFLKALDQTRPGGLVVGITSAGTMDKLGQQVRLEMARKAELVASVRLPAGTFQQYAGTKVVTDIVVLRRRDENSPMLQIPPWVRTAEVDTPSGTKIRVNQHYAENPESVLGVLDFGQGTTIRRPGMIVHPEADFPARLAAAVRAIPEGVYDERGAKRPERYVTNNEKDRVNSVMADEDGTLWISQGEQKVRFEDRFKIAVKSAKTTAERRAQIRDVVGIRRALGRVLDAQRDNDPKVEEMRKDLRRRYDAFVQAYGPVSSSFALKQLFHANDPHAPQLAALERNLAPAGEKPRYARAAILDRSTTRARPRPERMGVRDAYVFQRNEALSLEMARVAELAGTTEAAAAEELTKANAVYLSPAGTWEHADEYLSGNVRLKLAEARNAVAEGIPGMERNVAALEKVQPPDIPYFNIEAKLGNNWTTPEIYARFVADMLGLETTDGIAIAFSPRGWKVKLAPEHLVRPEARTNFGHAAMDFDTLVQHGMRSTPAVVRHWDEKDKVMRVDDAASEQANEKVAAMQEHFSSWVWQDASRRIALERVYNETYNNAALPSYTGEFLAFEGMMLEKGDRPFNLRAHQVSAIARGLITGRGIYAHEVGTGKTYTMAGIAIESRRYGKARKPLLFAHNANSATVAAEVNEMYPGAKVLYVDSLGKENRATTLAQIANDEWDLIVVPHSMADRFALRKETYQSLASEEIAELEAAAIAAASEDNVDLNPEWMDDEEQMRKVRSPTAKDLVRARNRVIARIDKMAGKAAEDALILEDAGVDMILVDEAHEFKKPPIATTMRMKGLNTDASDRSINLMFMLKYVNGINNGRGVHLFTGTPITNTLNEIYNMMRFVMPQEMKADGVEHWDAWFNTFAADASDVEVTPAGDYEAVSRLAAFVNVPELRLMAGQFMDTVFASDMPEFAPRTTPSGKTMDAPDLTEDERRFLLDGRSENPVGRPYKVVRNHVAPMTDAQLAGRAVLQARARAFRNMSKKARRETMLRGGPESPLRVESDAAKLGLDARLYDLDAPDEPDSKVNQAVALVLGHYREHDLACQAIFMEQGYHDYATRTETIVSADGTRTKRKYRVPAFNLAKDIVGKLVAGGIPQEQIAVVDGSVSKEKRKAIADAMNRAEIRVVIGSTQTLGTGVNMQENLRAMIHLDCPWRPGDMEQRNGRGERQGNKWNSVYEERMVTEGVDGRRWQVVVVKDKFIHDFLRSKGEQRIIEGDAASMEDDGGNDLLATLSDATGDPRILQIAKARKDLDRLLRRQRLHSQGIVDTEAAIDASRREIGWAEKSLAHGEEILATIAPSQDAEFSVVFQGKTYDTRKEAEKAIAESMEDWPYAKGAARAGTYRGMDLVPYVVAASAPPFKEPRLAAVHPGDRDLGANLHTLFSKGTLTGLDAVFRNFPGRMEQARAVLAEKEASIVRLQETLDAPFPQQEKLEKTAARLEHLLQDLTLNPVPPPAWLRQGTPPGTEVVYLREPRTVAAHQWTADGWYVLLEPKPGEKEPTKAPYRQVFDTQGIHVYEEREFTAPEVHERPQAEAEAEPSGQVRYSVRASEILEPRALTPQQTAEALRRAFPKAAVTIEGDGFRVALANGETFGVALVDEIEIDPAAFRRTYGRRLRPSDEARGAWFDQARIIQLARRADVGDIDHESFHVAKSIADISAAEEEILTRQFGDEESQARAYPKWAGKTDTPWGRVFAKIRQFFRKLARALGLRPKGDWEDIFMRIRSGQAFDQAPRRAAGQEPATVRYERTLSPAAQARDEAHARAEAAGDTETAQRMVDEAAEASGLPIIRDDDVTSWKARRGSAPKKTVTAYKLFATQASRPGELFPLFVGASTPLPVGIWLDATAGEEAKGSKSGRPKVKSKLGPLAYRPGWHAGDIPLATHIGVKDADGNIFARRQNEVWGEVEVAADVDYQPEADRNGRRPDGSISVPLADIKRMPTDGMYRYKTNPNMTGQWIISGSMKINRVLGEAEVNRILAASGMESMPWENGQLDLSALGLREGRTTSRAKLIDPFTYDDQGNLIPLSERFNPDTPDIRYSVPDGEERSRLGAFADSAWEGLRRAVGTDPDKGLRYQLRKWLLWGEGVGGRNPGLNRLEQRRKGAMEADTHALHRHMKKYRQTMKALDQLVRKGKVEPDVRDGLTALMYGTEEAADFARPQNPVAAEAYDATLALRAMIDARTADIRRQLGDILPAGLLAVMEENEGRYVLRAYRKFVEKGYVPARQAREAMEQSIADAIVERLDQAGTRMEERIASYYKRPENRQALRDYVRTGDEALLDGKKKSFQDRARRLRRYFELLSERLNGVLSVEQGEDGLELGIPRGALRSIAAGTAEWLRIKDTPLANAVAGRGSPQWKTIRKSFRKRKDLAKVLRTFYGEITDLAAVAQMTLARQNQILAADHFQRELMDWQDSLPNDDPDKLLYRAAWVGKDGRHFSFPLHDTSLGVLGKAEMFTDRATFELLQQVDDMPESGLLRAWMRVLTVGRFTHTVANPPTVMRNFLTNFLQSFADGEWFYRPSYWRGWRQAIRILWDAGPDLEDRIRSGVLSASARASELKANLSEAFGDPDTLTPHGIMQGVARLFAKGGRGLAWLYALGDNIHKLASYEAKISRGMAPEQALAEVRAAYPYYDMAPQAVTKFGRRMPFGPDFMSFGVEVIRNTINNWRKAARDARRGDLHALAGVLAIHGGVAAFGTAIGGAALAYALRKVTGDDWRPVEEDEEWAVRRMLPDYSRHGNHVLFSDEDGAIHDLELEYISPYDLITGVSNILREPGTAEDKGRAFGRYLWRQYGGFPMAVDTISQIVANHDPRTGRPVYLATDDPTDVAEKCLEHFATRVLVPSSGRRALRAFEILRSEEGSLETVAGEVITPGSEAAAALTPLRMRELVPEALFRARMGELSRALREARMEESATRGRVERGTAPWQRWEEATAQAERATDQIAIEAAELVLAAEHFLPLGTPGRKEEETEPGSVRRILLESGFARQDVEDIVQRMLVYREKLPVPR